MLPCNNAPRKLTLFFHPEITCHSLPVQQVGLKRVLSVPLTYELLALKPRIVLSFQEQLHYSLVLIVMPCLQHIQLLQCPPCVRGEGDGRVEVRRNLHIRAGRLAP